MIENLHGALATFALEDGHKDSGIRQTLALRNRRVTNNWIVKFGLKRQSWQNFANRRVRLPWIEADRRHRIERVTTARGELGNDAKP
jgi:hypothetical protein